MVNGEYDLIDDKIEYQILDEDEGYQKHNFLYKRRNLINQDQKDNGNKFLFKQSFAPLYELGEYLAYRIGQKTIGNVCRATLLRRSISAYSDKTTDGVASWFYLAEGDKMLNPIGFMEEYFNLVGKNPLQLQAFQNTVAESIDAIHWVITEKYGKSEEDFERVKQQFIDMAIFDLRFDNYDRNIRNWALYQDGKTGDINLYPLFDNETILGCTIADPYFIEHADCSWIYQEIKNVRTRYIVDDESRKMITGDESLKYFIRTYPEETKKAYEKVKRYTAKDFVEELKSFDKLTRNQKSFLVRMYTITETLFEKTYKETFKELEENEGQNVLKMIKKEPEELDER